jgi:hypothetical protein
VATYRVKSGQVLVVEGVPFPALKRVSLEGEIEERVLKTQAHKLEQVTETEDRGLRAPSHDRAVRPKGA